MSAVTVKQELDCVSDVRALWRVVSDTDRVNRASGMSGLTVKKNPTPGAARFVVETKVKGISAAFEDFPYEWVENERLRGRRVARSGPLKTIDADIALAAREGGGTRVTVEITVEPRSRWLTPIARLAAKRGLATWLEIVRGCDQALARGEAPFTHLAGPVRPPSTALDRAAEQLLAAATGPLRAPAERLIELMRRGDDAAVGHLRPFELAEEWGLDRRDVVAACLSAVVAGLLELHWGLVCPSCQQASDEVIDLAQIGENGHCHMCDLGFGVDFERAVEVIFRPAAAVRQVDTRPFCISGPARFPHVVVQAILEPGGAASLKAPADLGRYRLFVRGGAVAAVEVAADGASTVEVAAGERLDPPQVSIAPAGTLRVVDRAGGEARHVKLERIEFASRAATAHFLATIPTFRRLFSGQVIRPGLFLKVARAAFLFTDLAGSTALYTKIGDAAAFRVVMDHFDALRAEIERHKGALVKTIGDSIMAVFLDEADAARASVAMLRAFDAFRARTADAATLSLRVGLHSGACYAVNANKVLDYFGQTVNVAARLQGQAGGDEVVLAHDLAARAESAGWLDGAHATERFTCKLKGIDEQTSAVRVKV